MRDPKDVNILVVDDETSLRKAVVFDFKRKGFNVWDAGNGTEAFEIVKNRSIDVVLTDVRMPGGDGIQLLDNIKSLNPELPVVMFITGFADITLEEVYDRGVDAVFAKPFDRKALLTAVLRAVSEKDEQWASRKTERLDTDFAIDLSLPDLQPALQGHVMNIGRGGIFVALKDRFPSLDSRVQFSIKFIAGPLKSLEGTGIVRWIRARGDGDRPAGCGIEFDSLSDQGRGQVINLINQLKTRSYIPRA